MIINKTTSDTLLVSTLVVVGSGGKPIKNVTEFDTDTLQVTLSEGGPVTALSFSFATSSETEQASLYEMLDVALEPRVELSAKPYKAKKAMDEVVSPDDYLIFNSFVPPLQLGMATCTNCATKFLLFIAEDGELWTGAKADGDTFQTLTKVSDIGLICDNCSTSVAMFDENPR